MFNLKEYTMKMKSIFNKKILIAIATISSLSLQSCLDDDDNYAMRFPNAPGNGKDRCRPDSLSAIG